MANEILFRAIAHIESDFSEKFGIPRQSGLVEEVRARVVFEPEYRSEAALRGMEEFSHLWLIWHFSENVRDGWTATVRPPRLGGNQRMGVFATRSPFRPNGIGLSCVRFLEVERGGEKGPVICVAGADLMDGTPILDIKPYIPLTDCREGAAAGFSGKNGEYRLRVDMGVPFPQGFPEEKKRALMGVLAEDPRPAYQDDPDRIYGMAFAGYEVKFRVRGKTLEIVKMEVAR